MVNVKSQNNKLLPIYTPMIATSRPQIDILSLFDISDKNMIWFITYFFSLSILKSNDTLLFTDEITSVSLLNNCPMLSTHSYDVEMVTDKWNTLSEVIFDQIDNGYYVYISPDVYFIEEYKFHYSKNHFPHPMLIYGYNKEKDVVYAQDFFYYALESKEIGIRQFEEGMKSNYASSIFTCFKKRKYHHSIDLQFILKVLKYHLDSGSIYENDVFLLRRCINRYVFGLNCYEELKNVLERPLIFNDMMVSDEINHHTCHAVFDHCKILRAFIHYLYRKNYLTESQEINNEIQSLVDKGQIFQGLCLKYNISKSASLLKKIIDCLSQIKAKEELFLSNVYDELNRYYNDNYPALNKSDDVLDLQPINDITEADSYDEDNITYEVVGDDPVLMNNGVLIDASKLKYIYIKFHSTCMSETAQILFGKTKMSICEENSVLFSYSPYDKNITYIVDMTCCKNWLGMIYIMRFDPAVFNNKDENGEIQLMNFEICDRLPVYNSKNDFCKTQGVNGWFYYSYNRGITYKELIWDDNLWRAHNIGELNICNSYQTSYHNIASVRKWVCPADGEYAINVEYSQQGNNPLVEFIVKYDLNIILQKKYKDGNTRLQGTYEAKLNMRRGEAVLFEFYNASQHENEYFNIDITIEKISNIF